MATYRLFPSTSGPSSNTAYSGPYGVAVAFKVTATGLSLDGYWWWVAPTGGSTTAQKFCLWKMTGTNTGTLVSGSTVTSGTLVSGWNFISLGTSVALTSGQAYKAATAWTSSGGFPYSPGFYGTGGAGVGGIVNGPLTAYSDVTSNGGTNQSPYGDNQGTYQVSSADPTTTYPATGSSSFNGWMDVDITDGSSSSATATAAVANATAGAANASVTFGALASAQVANANAAAPNAHPTGLATNVSAQVAAATATAGNASAGGGVYTLFQPATGGASISVPPVATASSGNMLSGQMFTVTKGGCWFKGWYLYVCASGGQPTTPQKFALWAAYSQGSSGSMADTGSGTYGKLLASATSGTLVPGQWNFVPVATPVQLSVGGTYLALVGINGPYPMRTGVWNQAGTFPNGVTSGPLVAFSNGGAKYPNPVNSAPFTLPSSGSFAQIINSPYSVAGSDPTIKDAWTEPFEQDEYLFVDVAVTTAPPPVYSGTYRIWPNRYDAGPGVAVDIAEPWTMATEFKLSVTSLINRVWYFSPSGAASLATRVSVWDVSTGALFAGADWPAAWVNALTGAAATAACGWCYTDVSASGIFLPPGDYKVSVYNANGGSGGWSAGRQAGYWGGDTNTGTGAAGNYGEAPNGVISGPITVPVPLGTPPASPANRFTSSASPYTDFVSLPAQGTFGWPATIGNTYPSLYVTYGVPSGNTYFSESFWIDIELTPPGTAVATAIVANANATAQSPSVNSVPGAIAVAQVANANATAASPSVATSLPGTVAIAIVATASAQALPAVVNTFGGTVIAQAAVANALATAWQAVAGTAGLVYTFTPPVIYEVPTDNVDTDHPVMSRLMQYYRPRERGVAVYKMDDGTYWVSRQVPLLSGPGIVFAEPWPPLPVADQVNNVINTAWLYSRVVSQTVQTPGVVTVYYGAHSYQVTEAEAAAMTAAGLGNYVTVTAPS